MDAGCGGRGTCACVWRLGECRRRRAEGCAAPGGCPVGENMRHVPYLAVEGVAVQLVHHAQHGHVGAQRALAYAVAVEVELVLVDVRKVLRGRAKRREKTGRGSVCAQGWLIAYAVS